MLQEQPDDVQPIESPSAEPVTDLDTQPIPQQASPLPQTPQPIPQAGPPSQTPQPIILPDPQTVPQASQPVQEPRPITLSNPQPGASANRFDLRKISSGISQEWIQTTQEITAQWLYDLGGWIFGGLTITALLLLQVFILLSGFVDHATVVAGLAIAIALPFNLVGLGIVRYFYALNQTAEKARQALAQSSNLDAETLMKFTRASDAFSLEKRKVMDFSVSLALYLSGLFTLIGLSAALWRISWAATLLFLLACVGGAWLVWRVIQSS